MTTMPKTPKNVKTPKAKTPSRGQKTVQIQKEADAEDDDREQMETPDNFKFQRARKAADFTNIRENARYRPAPEWIADVLRAHNIRRGQHWAPPLVWNDECFEYAKRQADECITERIASNGRVDGAGGRMGQCVLGPPHGPWRMNRPGMAESIVDIWYGEGSHYNYDRPGFRNDASNFMQVIWFNTTSVGMALSRDGRFAVANYFPAGHDVLLEPPQNKAVRNYAPFATFPPAPAKSGKRRNSVSGNRASVNRASVSTEDKKATLTGEGFPSGPLEDRHEKECRYFWANVKPLREEPPPWPDLVTKIQIAEPDTLGEEPRAQSLDSARKMKRGNSKGKKTKLPNIKKSASTGNLGRSKSPKAAKAAAAMSKEALKKSKTAML